MNTIEQDKERMNQQRLPYLNSKTSNRIEFYEKLEDIGLFQRLNSQVNNFQIKPLQIQITEMKAFIVAALLVGLTVAQTTSTYDGSNAFCTAANETTACANLTDSCCGTVSTKIGAAAATSVTRCISRRLVNAISTNAWFMQTTNNVTLTYSCLTTAPTNYTAYPSCTNSSQCSSGQCCGNRAYTVQNNTNYNLTGAVCVPGDIGRDAGTNVTHKYNTASTLADISLYRVCYQSINTDFYATSNGVLLKSGFALVMVALLSFFTF